MWGEKTSGCHLELRSLLPMVPSERNIVTPGSVSPVRPRNRSGRAVGAFRRPELAFTVSAFARDDPLVCDLYDDDEVEEVGSQQVCCL